MVSCCDPGGYGELHRLNSFTTKLSKAKLLRLTQLYKEASQTRDPCVAKNATLARLAQILHFANVARSG
jgi:hypothetical protein